jgi:hypothetical protein
LFKKKKIQCVLKREDIFQCPCKDTTCPGDAEMQVLFPSVESEFSTVCVTGNNPG